MSLAEELLENARRESPASVGWIARLKPEHQLAVEQARDQWRKAGGHLGISANSLARSIINKMATLGYTLPKTKQVAVWLNHSR